MELWRCRRFVFGFYSELLFREENFVFREENFEATQMRSSPSRLRALNRLWNRDAQAVSDEIIAIPTTSFKPALEQRCPSRIPRPSTRRLGATLAAFPGAARVPFAARIRLKERTHLPAALHD
jgi:hypothetical protein